MAHRDELFNARRLATSSSSSRLLTFFGSNQTFRISSLGFLHYAIVVVGTPPLTFLVALDTGSDLFWLPCDCTNCARSANLTTGRSLDLNIYSTTTSSTSSPVACNSTMCGEERQCSVRFNACAYQEVYLSANTSTTGILVDDVLHLGTNSDPQDLVDVPITLGCGMVQTGDFVENAAINGLFGLGMDNISVPSILASKGLTANSFSMCFGRNGLGRIEFGDKGSPNQKVTPFNLRSVRPTYNVTVTQIAVGDNVTDLEFTVIVDSGTSFTYLNDPAYSVIADAFNSQITNEPPYQSPQPIIFDFCYSLSATQESFTIPTLNFTMKGGSQYSVKVPYVVIPRQGGFAYCLAIVKSDDINLMGQNFLTGHRIVFDREEMVLGWNEDDCSGSTSSGTGGNTLPVSRGNSSGAPPPSVFNPEETPAGTDTPATPGVLPRSLSPPPPPPPPSSLLAGSGAAAVLSWKGYWFGVLMVSLWFYQFIILSS
ncbi:aspartyl protease family protein 1-like isoform X2 [Andrographis paniculata]|nr:aspartyl protease family protein 1-like isoform X2 [Andrographis paniculata]